MKFIDKQKVISFKLKVKEKKKTQKEEKQKRKIKMLHKVQTKRLRNTRNVFKDLLYIFTYTDTREKPGT